MCIFYAFMPSFHVPGPITFIMIADAHDNLVPSIGGGAH
jgi:hypothetical protein